MSKSIDLSIVIGNYNTRDLLRKTISSIYKNTSTINFEIIVVDDHSSDDSVAMVKMEFPKVKIVVNKINQGYSRSYNIGTKKSKGTYILHLNSDVIFLTGHSLEEAIKYLQQHKDVGILGCKLLKINNKLDLPCKRSFPTIFNVFFQTVGLSRLFPKNKFFGRYYLTFFNEDCLCEVDCIMGAFMMIRRKVIKEVGYLDERFFIYGEDIDYCQRTKKAEWKIVYYPKVTVKHYHGGTTRKFKWRHIWLFHYAMFQYYDKHHAQNNIFIINDLVYLGIITRFFVIIINELIASSLQSLHSKFKLMLTKPLSFFIKY